MVDTLWTKVFIENEKVYYLSTTLLVYFTSLFSIQKPQIE